MRRLLTLIVLLVPVASFAQGESVAALYNRANALYSQGQFSGAIELYEKALSSGFENRRIEYNLGNAYLKNNPPDLAHAVLHYERARRLDPRDPDIRYNLRYVSALIKGKLPQAQRSFILRGFEAILRNITPRQAIAAFSILYFCLTSALTVYFLSRGRKWRRAMAYIGAAIVFIMVIEAPVAWGSLTDAAVTRAVILSDNLAVRSGPGPDNPELFKLFEGNVVERQDCRGGWCMVSIPGGLAGWIPAEKAEKI